MLKVYGFLALTTIPLALLARTDKTVPADRRVDCHPEPNASKQICESRKCIWDESMKVPEGVPFCYFPQETGLHFVSHSGRTTNLKKLEDPHSPYGRDYDRVSMTTEEKGATLHVVFSSKGSFELPIELQNEPSKSKDSLSVKRLGSSGVFKFQIVRDSTNTAIWDTSLGGLIFADQFIQIAALLGASKIYGFGENIHQTLMHNISRYTTWPMFARDEAPYSVKPDTKNLYGVHAFYLGIEKDNKAHGVLFMNGGAQEVTIGPAPHLIYRAIGGQLDIHFFPGPSPHDVIEQYLALVGRPYLPAYWGLGFQLSRWGYKGLDDMKESVEAVRKAKIPLDVPYADIDYMHRYEDFTIDEKVCLSFFMTMRKFKTY
ncbi:hypothetical protein AB6A40_003759 [Gnathostoma spinigerum]|uniref:P-type domain-containing protein n=1 Tax=Gnathostoma spinigerum TaxID=75299 RepID=A0ABD6EBM6_9BILA